MRGCERVEGFYRNQSLSDHLNAHKSFVDVLCRREDQTNDQTGRCSASRRSPSFKIQSDFRSQRIPFGSTYFDPFQKLIAVHFQFSSSIDQRRLKWC